jgi:integration host factor subunit alpha
MAGKNVTRADLTEAVYQQGVVTKDYAADLVDQVLESICTALEVGENVKLSSFGVFTVRTKAKRTGRNPKTGAEVSIEPRRVVQFSASPVLKAHLNRGSTRPSSPDAQDLAVPGSAQHETAS